MHLCKVPRMSSCFPGASVEREDFETCAEHYYQRIDAALGEEEMLVTTCVNERSDVPEAIRDFLGQGR